MQRKQRRTHCRQDNFHRIHYKRRRRTFVRLVLVTKILVASAANAAPMRCCDGPT